MIFDEEHMTYYSGISSYLKELNTTYSYGIGIFKSIFDQTARYCVDKYVRISFFSSKDLAGDNNTLLGTLS